MANPRTVPRTSPEPPLIIPAAALLACVAAVQVAAWLTRAAAVPGIPAPDAVVAYGVPTVRALLWAGVTAVIGLSLLPGLVATRTEAARQAVQRRYVLSLAARATFVAAVVWQAGALLAVVLQTAELSPATGATPGAVVGYIAQFGAAQALVGSAVAALLAAGFAVLGVRAPTGRWHRGTLVAAGLGLLPLVASTHSGELAPRWHGLTTISLEVHVLAATAWLGGLAALATLTANRPALLVRALPRFSGLAALCLGTVAVSGVLNAVVELAGNGFAALVGTRYGLLVLGKIACLAVAACLGGRVRYRLLPLIVQRRATGIVLWLAAEIAVLGVALGLAAVLSRTASG